VADLTFHRMRASALPLGRRPLVCAPALVLLALAVPAAAWGASLEFVTAPKLPTLPAVTLNAQAQTVTTTMNSFSVSDTRLTKSGWNVTVNGQSGTGKSAVFAQYCPSAKCGSDSEGYVGGGQTLPAKSLTLNTTGASWTGGAGPTPAFQCSSSCNVDSASAVKITSTAAGGLGTPNTWTTTGFSATSLSLATSSQLRVLPASEVYRVNIIWTLSTGP
jgi:hypothetical protein